MPSSATALTWKRTEAAAAESERAAVQVYHCIQCTCTHCMKILGRWRKRLSLFWTPRFIRVTCHEKGLKGAQAPGLPCVEQRAMHARIVSTIVCDTQLSAAAACQLQVLPCGACQVSGPPSASAASRHGPVPQRGCARPFCIQLRSTMQMLMLMMVALTCAFRCGSMCHMLHGPLWKGAHVSRGSLSKAVKGLRWPCSALPSSGTIRRRQASIV